MSTPSPINAKRKSKSLFAAKLLTAYANRLLLTSAIDSRGALGRSLLIPFIRGIARVFGWWSRGWLGQALGGKWSVSTFKRGFANSLDPREIGDAWEDYRNGNVKRP
ncbi:hypothetical protein BH24CHL4_BH24CHL4_15590 [soil metagenome]